MATATVFTKPTVNTCMETYNQQPKIPFGRSVRSSCPDQTNSSSGAPTNKHHFT
jgi:hypothetical protein